MPDNLIPFDPSKKRQPTKDSTPEGLEDLHFGNAIRLRNGENKWTAGISREYAQNQRNRLVEPTLRVNQYPASQLLQELGREVTSLGSSAIFIEKLAVYCKFIEQSDEAQKGHQSSQKEQRVLASIDELGPEQFWKDFNSSSIDLEWAREIQDSALIFSAFLLCSPGSDPKLIANALHKSAVVYDQYEGKELALSELLSLATLFNSDEPFVHERLAIIYYQCGSLELAATECQLEIQVSPDNPQPHFLQSMIHSDNGNPMDALKSYEEGVRLAKPDLLKKLEVPWMHDARLTLRQIGFIPKNAL